MGIFLLVCILQSSASAFIHHEIQDYKAIKVNFADISSHETSSNDVSLNQMHETLSIVDSIVQVIESSLASFDDPIVIDDVYENYKSDKISYKVRIKGITISGLSGAVIKDVSIKILPTRVVFDLALPRLVFNVDSCVVVVIVHGVRIEINISGKIIVINSRLGGTIGIKLLPPGVSSVNANLQVGTIKSTMVGSVADVDIRPILSLVIEHYLPLILDNLSGQIDAAISAYILDVIRSHI